MRGASSEDPTINFTLHAIELHCCEASARGKTSQSTLIAGELGYSIGRVYTSLSGFSTSIDSAPGSLVHVRGVGTGTMQLVLLGRWLQRRGYAFWSLGHCYSPAMEYKRQLGHRVLPREAFLAKLQLHRGTLGAPMAACTENEPPFRPGDHCDCACLIAPFDGSNGSVVRAVDLSAGVDEKNRSETANQTVMDSWGDDDITKAGKPKPMRTGRKKKKKGKKGKKT